MTLGGTDKGEKTPRVSAMTGEARLGSKWREESVGACPMCHRATSHARLPRPDAAHPLSWQSSHA